jgi:hypothetical protein
MPPLFDQTSREKPLEKESNLRNIFWSCVKLLNEKNSLQVLQRLLEKWNSREEMKLGQKIVNQVRKKRRMSREFRLNKNIGVFNMGNIILDLGSEVNVLPKKT